MLLLLVCLVAARRLPADRLPACDLALLAMERVEQCAVFLTVCNVRPPKAAAVDSMAAALVAGNSSCCCLSFTRSENGCFFFFLFLSLLSCSHTEQEAGSVEERKESVSNSKLSAFPTVICESAWRAKAFSFRK